MRYYVTSNGRTRDVELVEKGIRVGDRVIEAEMALVPGSSEGHLRLGNRGYLFHGGRDEAGWTIEIGGRRFALEVETERARSIRLLTGADGPWRASRDLRAPMPGLIVRVLVERGQTVEAGHPLLVVEAMKMENELRAESSGTVATVAVEEGQAVNQGELLITFETEEP